MAFGIHMININGELKPPCTQFEIATDRETLIQSKDKPIPYLIMTFAIIFITILLAIAIKISHRKTSIVMPLNQPRDLANPFIAFFMILTLIDHTINQ